MLLFGFLLLQKIEESGKTIYRCQEKGWDGAKFIDRYSTKMICSNFTKAEKDAIVSNSEKKGWIKNV